MPSAAQAPVTGANIIANTLKDLGVTSIFGIVGVPVSDIAEQAINIGIRFIGFRNEQAASYAATAYGFLTGKPGVGNASENNFPLLLLGGSIETHLVTKGGFQELDSISLLTPHSKLSVRPPSVDSLPSIIANAYRCAFYGRPGTGFVDLPADIINDPLTSDDFEYIHETPRVADPPKGASDVQRLDKVVNLIKGAQAPLVLIGKGAAYGHAENVIRNFINRTHIPFLPSPMGKGVVPDSHVNNVSSARSAALKSADVVLIFGARLNWIFHYGEAPKWNPAAQFIQVDISPEEMGRNAADAELSLVGDVAVVVSQLAQRLSGWKHEPLGSEYIKDIDIAKQKNEQISALAAKDSSIPLSYGRAFDVIKKVLHTLSPPSDGGICYIAEGANTMDISRSIFPLEHPRLRLDAGTYATMGVGLPYAIAAWEAYNGPNPQASSGSAPRKKIVAIEGDSAFGFSGMEVETMARMGMDVLIFVINNGGIYFGDSNSAEDWTTKQGKTKRNEPGLRSWALGWEVNYQKFAEACGGIGFLVRTPEELQNATVAGFNAKVPTIVNVIIQSGKVEKATFGWQVSPKRILKSARL
ncbi:hypothetical protein N0V83_003927 [Neocucurbitaria cava]|uniref:2-hydroxyacyl-CoA lyase n=1 Tax=Neocucurbitaria cava TaxID=798079 RepID=A0A9W8YAW1_9PLEO|nr:hypothetical protein N0V83_003927 [Neocucurbitaria cava]